tara:strand:- start:1878 stop:2561 length:684 start_codon:yes stop_codon:yes gene_type:complete
MRKFYRIILLIIIFVLLTTYNSKHNKIFQQSKDTFFKITKIEIVGNKLTKSKEIKEKLNDIYGKNILFIKEDDIKKPLKSISFLDKIEVKKKYPNDVVITVFETEPLAIIYKDNIKYILDSSSNLIDFNENIFSEDFPIIFGEYAEKYFINFFDLLRTNEFPTNKIKNYYYFQVNRWDLQLSNKQIIKFPADQTEKAIIKSIELLKRKDFLEYNIIDLRIHDKIVVE